jgi:protein phosphatase
MKCTSYTHIGKKEVNEDFVVFSDKSFIVCDGVGGEVRGEIASKEIASFILKELSDFDGDFTKNQIHDTIINAQEHLNSLIKEKENLEGMATTLAAAFIYEQGVYISHIGDSRVYVVRPSLQTFWHTWDHSLVGGLVKNGDISREDGRNHPMNNQIFKAIKANFKDKVTAPEIHKITDLRKKDILFICSDGISEAFSDVELLELLGDSDKEIQEKLDIIEERCSKDSYDNNTAIICEIEKKDLPHGTLVPIEWTSIASLHEVENLEDVIIEESNLEEEEEEIEEEPKKKKWYHF